MTGCGADSGREALPQCTASAAMAPLRRIGGGQEHPRDERSATKNCSTHPSLSTGGGGGGRKGADAGGGGSAAGGLGAAMALLSSFEEQAAAEKEEQQKAAIIAKQVGWRHVTCAAKPV